MERKFRTIQQVVLSPFHKFHHPKYGLQFMTFRTHITFSFRVIILVLVLIIQSHRD